MRLSPGYRSRTIREGFPDEMRFKWRFGGAWKNFSSVQWWGSVAQCVQAHREEKLLRVRDTWRSQ